MKPTEDEFGLRLAAKAANREKAFAEHWPAVRAQLEQRGYSSWGDRASAPSAVSRWDCGRGRGSAPHGRTQADSVTLTREQRREQQLHRMAFRHGLRLRKSVRGDERARHFGTYGSMTNET